MHEDWKKKLQESFPNIEILSDTDWELNKITSSPSRGLRDYDRKIVTRSALSSSETDELIKYFKHEAFHREIGWTGVWLQHLPDNTYKFTTTWDSSG